VSKLAAATIAFALLSCSGSEDSGPSGASGTLIAFSGSACKKESQSSALTAADAYAGLSCIRWKPSAAGLQIDLVNFEGACGAQWHGSATATATGIELVASNPSCLLAACGSCMYDWGFEVHAGTDQDLPIDIVTDPCPGEQPAEKVTATLPLATAASGELCRYASYGGLGWQAAALGHCGMAFMPCREAGGLCDTGSATTACDPGLECAGGASAAERVCHPSCATDADCALPGILACQSGSCRPSLPW
jgi:hypothetical protein